MPRPRIVLLHAFPLDCRMWAETRPALEAAGWTISAPDLPGPEAKPELGAWADRVLRTVDGPFVPVGVSMGGYLTFELWRRARARIPAAVLISTRASGETDESRRTRNENIRILEERGAVALWERLEPNLFPPGVSPNVVARAKETALEQGTERLTAALRAIRDRTDSVEVLREMDVPVLVVAGEADAIIDPSESEAMATELPAGRLVRIPSAGHLLPLERPTELSDLLVSFLADVTAGME